MLRQSVLHAQENSKRNHLTAGVFFARFKKNLLLEVKRTGVVLFAAYAISMSLLYGALKFMFEFSYPKEVFAFLLPPIVIFLAAQYLTLLPTFLALVLACVEKKIAGKILGFAMIASFFIVFLV